MSAFKRINKSDLVTIPYTANKHWSFDSSTMASSSIFVYTGVKITGSFDSWNEPMTANSQYQRLVYDSINHQFYQAYSGSTVDSNSLLNSNNYESASGYGATASYFNTRNISYDSSSFPQGSGSTIHVISIPTNVYGNSLNAGTFVLSSSAYNIVDDGYGNLIDSGSIYVGNIFYAYGVAVITNPAYQSYFTDTITVPLRWTNYNTPSGYYINDTLNILVNGVKRAQSSANEGGRFTSNVGDVISIESYGDGTWPADGSGSLTVTITGQPNLYTSSSTTHVSGSFTLVDQTPIYINAYTSFTPYIPPTTTTTTTSTTTTTTTTTSTTTTTTTAAPATIIWSLNEYTSSGVFLDGNFRIQTVGGGTVFLNQLTGGTGSLTIPAGTTIQVDAYSFTNDLGSASYWGSYVSASLSGSVVQTGTTIASNTGYIYKNGGTIDVLTSPSVTLSSGGTYYVYVQTLNPVLPPTTTTTTTTSTTTTTTTVPPTTMYISFVKAVLDFTVSLSGTLSSNFRVQNLLATGYSDSLCTVPVASSQLNTNPLTVSAGSMGGTFPDNSSLRTGTWASATNMSISTVGGANSVSIDPGTGIFQSVTDGGTITIGGTTVLVSFAACTNSF